MNFIENMDVKFLCKFYFNEDLTLKQEEIVRSIVFKLSNRIVISCLTRYGKSFCVAMAVLLFIKFNPNKKIGLIAPIKEQTGILRNYIADFALRHNDFRSLLELDVVGLDRLKREVSKSRLTFTNGCSLQVLSAEGKASRLMGWGFDLIILDESCLINPDVYKQKISRMLGDSEDSVLVEIGNPWSRDSHMFSHWNDDGFLKIHVGWEDAVDEGRVSRVFVEEQRSLLDSISFDVLYNAVFPESSEDALISADWINSSVDKFDFVDGEVFFGLDVAEGGADLSVLTKVVKKDNKFRVLDVLWWRKSDTMETVKVVLDHVRVDCPVLVFVDAIGVGKGVSDALAHEGVSVVGVKVGNASNRDRDRFLNLKAEYYWNLRVLFENGLISILNKGDLVKELKSMRYELTSSGKVRIVDPELKSPDFCFVGDTLVDTINGKVCIKDLRVGDLVRTPFGFRRVLGKSKRFSKSVFSVGLFDGFKRSVLGVTGEHKVFDGKFFKPVNTLMCQDKLVGYSIGEVLKWKLIKWLFIKEKNIGYRELTENIFTMMNMMEKEIEKKLGYIDRFGKMRISKKFLKDLLFIIKTKILLIIGQKILVLLKEDNTKENIFWRILKRKNLKKKFFCLCRKLKRKLKNGINLKKVWSGIKNIMKKVLVSIGKIRDMSMFVLFVVKYFILKGLIGLSIVRKNVEILGLEKSSDDFVYNITVDVDGVYYANGVLVSNCDSLMLACCGGFGFEYISGLEKLFNLD